MSISRARPVGVSTRRSSRSPAARSRQVVGGEAAGDEVEGGVGEGQALGGASLGVDVGQAAAVCLEAHGVQHGGGEVAGGDGSHVRGEAVGDVAAAAAEVKRAQAGVLAGPGFELVEVRPGGMGGAGDVGGGLAGILRGDDRLVASAHAVRS